jgi:hypothetical protein
MNSVIGNLDPMNCRILNCTRYDCPFKVTEIGHLPELDGDYWPVGPLVSELFR